MIDRRKLEELVWDLTVGSGEGELSTTEIVGLVEDRLGQRLDAVQARIVQRKNDECRMAMEHP